MPGLGPIAGVGGGGGFSGSYAADTDATIVLGRAAVNASSSDFACFTHYDLRAHQYASLATGYGINSLGSAYVNATDIALKANGALLFNLSSGGAIGFFGGAGTTKPTVSGSKGANAALSSLMTALSGLGLVTDSTS